MNTDPDTPVLGPGDHLLQRNLAFSTDRYGERFTDVDFWRPYVELICVRHGVPPTSIQGVEPGTFPTFIVNRSRVVKLFGAPFDGLRCWRTELDVETALGEAPTGIPVPEVFGAGVLSNEPEWRYIVSRFVEGASFARVRDRLDPPRRMQVARELGPLLRAVHDLDGPDRSSLRWDWVDWASFIDGQKRGLVERHRGWGTLPGHLIEQLDGYVAAYRVDAATRPALVHADLHQDHLLGEVDPDGTWRVTGVIDRGDARIGDRYYDLPALHLGLFHGDAAMLRSFLASYGWDGYRSDTFVWRAMTVTLLHEFDVLEKVGLYVDLERIQSLEQLADAIWRA